MTELTTAEDILSAMAGAYTRCRSYRDVGTHTTHMFPNGRAEHTDEKRFSTAFVRPDRFRFEYRDRFFPHTPEKRCVTWARGDEVRQWEDLGEGATEQGSYPSLREALEVLGGVSSHLSWVVPLLLIPGWGNGKPWHLHERVRLDDDSIGGVDCYRVQGRFGVRPGHDEECQRAVREDIDPNAVWNPQVSPVTFWIEKERLLLRRFADSGRVMNFRFERLADYQPEIDVPITEAELALGIG